MMEGGLFVVIVFAMVALFILAKTAIVVPQQSAFVVERLGRYSGTLDAGFHILVPFIDVIRYRHSLKEAALDIPAQIHQGADGGLSDHHRNGAGGGGLRWLDLRILPCPPCSPTRSNSGAPT